MGQQIYPSHLRIPLFCCLFLSFQISASRVCADEAITSYSFVVVPQQKRDRLVRSWVPLLKHLSEKSGVTLMFETANSIPDFEKFLESEKADFAYMNPSQYVSFHKNGYSALAHARDRYIRGIMVVRKDSAIQSLEDLAGKHLAFPAPSAFAASLLTRVHLREQNVNFTPAYLGSHDAVYEGVARGTYVAGGGIWRTFRAAKREWQNSLRVLFETKKFTPHAVAVHSRVPKKISESVQKALLALEKADAGVPLLERLQLKGWVAAEDSKWDGVRDLDLSILKE